MESFADKARALLEKASVDYGNVSKLAEFCGVKTATLSRWISGDRNPLAEIGKAFDALGVSLSKPGISLTEYLLVPKVKAVAGAGASYIVDDDPTGLYAFRRAFLEREHISASNLVMMMVMGDSMEPLIRDGDTVLVDQTDATPVDGRIYVLRIDDALMVKRMEKIPGGWRVKSDNPDRGFYDLRGDELESLQVFGRVRWFGRVV